MTKLDQIFTRWNQQRSGGLVPDVAPAPVSDDQIRWALRRADAPEDAVLAFGKMRKDGPVRAAIEFCARPATSARFLTLLGTKGNGKTFAAVFAMGELMRIELGIARPSGGEGIRGDAGAFVRASTLGRLSAYDWADKQWFRDMLHARVLLIDDLGTEHPTPTFLSQFYELIDTRGSKHRRTIITSNLSRKAFAAQYGERITDRLREHGISEEFTGPSLRVTLPKMEAACAL